MYEQLIWQPSACFYPDEDRASIWQFELLKSGSQMAYYVIVHRVWMWERMDNLSEEGWISFENCSYLAIKENYYRQDAARKI